MNVRLLYRGEAPGGGCAHPPYERDEVVEFLAELQTKHPGQYGLENTTVDEHGEFIKEHNGERELLK